MNETQIRRTDFAYAGYLVPAAWCLVALLLVGYRGIASDENATSTVLLLQWTVMLPLAMVSVCATLVGLWQSLRLRGCWAVQRGLVVVPLALLTIPMSSMMEWNLVGEVCVVAYTLIAGFYGFRWFLKERGRAVREVLHGSDTQAVGLD